MKLVLCQICVGTSMCRSETDTTSITRCPSGYQSVYIPGAKSGDACTGVFNDTYILYDETLAIPTHVVSYHFEVPQLSAEDGDIVRWVNTQCETILGFSETNFTHFLVNLTQNSDSITSLRSRLRDQADVPAAAADALAETLFAHVPRGANGDGLAPRLLAFTKPYKAAHEVSVSAEQVTQALLMLDLAAEGGPSFPSGTLFEACNRINDQMLELDPMSEALQVKSTVMK